jgi:hypothetical protein
MRSPTGSLPFGFRVLGFFVDDEALSDAMELSANFEAAFPALAAWRVWVGSSICHDCGVD